MQRLFSDSLAQLDTHVAGLVAFEAERQIRKLILIPSESQAPAAVRQALGSVFQNIYAEGYPNPSTHGAPQSSILDYEHQLAFYRRYSDRRYYKGVEYADILESLAQRRAAEAFAQESVPPEQIWANVQPLSGSPANSAVYAALVPPGSTVMGMDLLHGGHLTHGSPANRSGKLYDIVSYGIDEVTERLDYDAIAEQAVRHKPKMIIAGYTSYPWMPDWESFRRIADLVGAYLLADISHIAGMVAAGVVPSPVGHAHVTSFTTHKTLYGPRGACILTTDEKLAKKVDAAVFPGEQGGPHVNAMVGMAVAFGLARTATFVQLQRQVLVNARQLAEELEKRGFRIPYGGTDTHMLLVDCKSVRSGSGVSPDGVPGTPLMGDPAARILDLAGIVLNRNTIPGDRSARNPSGIRLGTPWITQRGFGEDEIRRLAELIVRVLTATRPFAYAGRHGPVYRAKVDFDELERTKWDVVDLACCADLARDYAPSGYPHHYFMHKPSRDLGGTWDVLEIEGTHARGFCNVAMSNDVYALKAGESQPTWILKPDGSLLCGGVLMRPGERTTRFQLLVRESVESRAAHWLRALSDGYVQIDPDDVFAKAPGPVVVRRLPHDLADAWQERPPPAEEFDKNEVGWACHKPYWIGQRARAASRAGLDSRAPFLWKQTGGEQVQTTAVYESHVQAGAAMADVSGWQLPLSYTNAAEEHLAVRNAAGLFDLGHLGLLEFTGPNVHLFLNTLTTNDVSLLGNGQSQYSFMLMPDGQVLDDLLLYRLGDDLYWMVVNAENHARVRSWVDAVRQGRVLIDPDRPWACALGTEEVLVRDLGDSNHGRDMRAIVSLQGPLSREILLRMLETDGPVRESLLELERNGIVRGRIAGYDLYISRTGYTGEPMGFELFVHPSAAPALWHSLLDTGEPLGICSAGMDARDSLRVEAGLPRNGRELAGVLNLSPADAGFEPYVKLYKPYFVGKRAYLEHEQRRKARLIRFQLDDERAGVPMPGDVVVSGDGDVVGTVCSGTRDSQGCPIGLAYVQSSHTRRGAHLGVFHIGDRTWSSKPLATLRTGDRVQLHEDITVIARFLNKKA